MRHVYCTGYRPDTSDDGTMDEEAPSTKVVVKFIARYGKEAHELLAREGYAPRLPYYGPVSRTPLSGVLPGPAERSSPGLCLRSDLTYMVVMDYVEASSKIPSDARQQISSALKLLHPKGYIFGDLREQNVLFDSAGKVKFIKFKRSKAFGNLTPISALPFSQDTLSPSSPAPVFRLQQSSLPYPFTIPYHPPIYRSSFTHLPLPSPQHVSFYEDKIKQISFGRFKMYTRNALHFQNYTISTEIYDIEKIKAGVQ